MLSENPEKVDNSDFEDESLVFRVYNLGRLIFGYFQLKLEVDNRGLEFHVSALTYEIRFNQYFL